MGFDYIMHINNNEIINFFTNYKLYQLYNYKIQVTA